MAEQDTLIQAITLDLEGFLHRLGDLLDAAWGTNWGRLTEQEPTGTDPQNLDLPVITFHLEERRPSESKLGIKARTWETRPDPDYPGHSLEVARQWFDCDISLTAWHTTHAGVKELTRRLEYFLLAFAGYFKDIGVSELVWTREKAPYLSNSSGTGLPSRTLTYMLRLERILVIRRKNVEAVAYEVLTRDPISGKTSLAQAGTITAGN